MAILFGFIFINKTDNLLTNNSNQISNKLNTPQLEKNYIFVPYWTFNEEISVEKYSDVIYFGVSIDEFGVNKNEPGYRQLEIFSNSIDSDKNKYLTLRILGEDTGREFLDNINLQKTVGREVADIAKEYNFDGVLVDFETSAFGFSSTEEKITAMFNVLHEEIKRDDLEFLVAVFGDNYYRARPYDIEEIGNISDKVIIMMYDFHKARLNPGPNFPFSDKESYGYDMKTMIKDFEKDLDYDKIVVTLGYFGYDWKMENGVSTGMAEPMSLNQIEDKFLNNCKFVNCKLEKNNDFESVVRYEDDEGFSHEVWFENIESAKKKIEYLNSVGINQIALWAYSYY